MASTRFNNNILVAARRLQQNRSVAGPGGDTGNRYTSARLSDYQNRAIRDLIKAKYDAAPEVFPLRYPQMMKTSDPFTINALTRIAIPSDVWLVTELWLGSLKFKKVPDHRIGDVLSGVDRLIVPSVNEPAFFTENGYMYFLPDTGLTGEVKYRFVKEHADIAVNTAASGVGNKNTANGAFTVATKQLTAAMSIAFADSDVGKKIIFATVNGIGTLTGVYESLIFAKVSATEVTIGGDYLPTANEIVSTVLVSDYTPELSDIQISKYDDGAIIDLMVGLATTDQAAKP